MGDVAAGELWAVAVAEEQTVVPLLAADRRGRVADPGPAGDRGRHTGGRPGEAASATVDDDDAETVIGRSAAPGSRAMSADVSW